MTNVSTARALTKAARRVWKSAQLYVGFHKDQQGRTRDKAHVWPPKNGNASIHADPSEQEAFIVVKGVDKDAGQDVQIKLRPDRIVVRRDTGMHWQGVQIESDTITVRTAEGVHIKIGYDGSIIRHTECDETAVEADGTVYKRTEFAEARMSGSGVDMSRRTATNLSAITESGVSSKARDGG